MKFLILTVILSVTFFANGQVGENHFLTPNLDGSFRLADMDNDGDLDYVHLSNIWPIFPNRDIVWFENLDGQANDWLVHPIEGVAVSSVNDLLVLEDINSDGWIDIIYIDAVLISNGNASNIEFTAVPHSYIDIDDFGDIDGDGDNDLLIAHPDNGTIKYHINENQDGTFGNPQQLADLIPGENYQYSEAHMVDMDQDGDLDIVTCFEILSQNNFYMTWYENIDNADTFSTPKIIVTFPMPNPLNNIETFHFLVDDFNGDAKMDILLSNNVLDKIIYYQITGTVWNEQALNDNSGMRSMAAADFDNDGDIDILTHGNSSFDIVWYENIDNSENFTPNTISNNYMDAPGFFRFQLGDFDNDGDIDISLINNYNGLNNFNGQARNGIYLMKNELGSTASFPDIYKIHDVIAGFIKPFPLDMDGDEDNDLLIFSHGDQEHYWLENLDGTNEFSYQNLILTDEGISVSEVADLDSDGDGDIIGINDNYQLVWYENISDSTVAFGPKQIIAIDVLSKSLIVDDFDNDGDFDIGAHKSPNGAILWFEQDAMGDFSEHFVASLGLNTEMLHFGDFDNDGLKDILYKNVVSGEDQLSYFKQEVDASFTSVFLYEGIFWEVEIADLENDFDIDIVIKYDEGSGFLLKILHNEAGDFNEHQIIFDATNFVPKMLIDFSLVDIDNDGKKDIYFGGKYYHKQLVDAINFSPRIDLGGFARYGLVAAADLSDDGVVDFIGTTGDDGLAWDENLLGQGVWVEGQVALDLDEDCMLDSTVVNTWLLSFEQNGETYYTSTNINGYYAAFFPEAGDYTVNVVLPNLYWGTCVVDTLLSVDSTTYLDFPIQINYECPLMQTVVTSGNLRPCFDGTLTVAYCNSGTEVADSATVEVVLDEVLLFNSASLPYTETDSSYLFEVGDMGLFECGTIQISVTPDCDSTELGDIVCATAYVTPDSICIPTSSPWDGSSIVASGFCENDTVFFQIENVGEGNMSVARQFRIEIANDDIVLMIIADTFFLESGEAKTVSIPSGMEVLRIEADQDENHPLLTAASALVTDCADFEIPENLFAVYSGNPFSFTYCRALTEAYDPNIKTVNPTGYGAENLIDREWELEYTIHFQNTGNDTAFNVVLRDIISPHLDLSTLRIGASSHLFSWSLETSRELTFTFENILLPDSTTNEPASHGYVQLFLTPMPGAPFGTLIENRADIYFDFNEPILTNKTSQTIRTPIFATSEHLEVCEGEEIGSVFVTGDQLIVDSMLTAEGLYLDFYYVTMLPVSSSSVDVDVPYGATYLGVEITQDTILEEVYIATNGCDSTIFHNVSSLVSTQELQDAYGLVVYPQPVKDILHVSWNDDGSPTAYTVMTMDGRLLKQVDLTSGAMRNPLKISMSDMPNGVYWMRLDFARGNVYYRVVKM